jgi:hypothetical protein
MWNKRLIWLTAIIAIVGIILSCNVGQSGGNITVSKTAQVGLPRSPAVLVSNGKLLLVADRGGSLLFWQWSQPPGPVIKGHDDGGMAVAVGRDFATSGGWDSTVKRWDGTAQKPRFSVKPFDARVTALCAQGEDILVGGSNRDTAPKKGLPKDRVFLQPGQLFRVDAMGKLTAIPIKNVGEIDGIACGVGWILVSDRGAKDVLRWIHGNENSTIQLEKGPATALVSRGSEALVADKAGIWTIDPQRGTRKAIVTLGLESPQILALVPIEDSIFAATSEGVFRWPGATRFSREGVQPTALTHDGDSLLVLWEDGLLEQRDAKTGQVIHTEKVPQE